MTISFRRPTLDDAALLLEWRSQPRINEMMFTNIQPGDISKHREWLKSCEVRNDYEHFIILGDDKPVGYLSYSEIDQINGHCSCGSYFGTPEGARKFGGHVHAYFMDYIFYVLNMRKYVIHIMDSNTRVLKLQRLLGLREVGVLKEHIIKGGIPKDVYVFELLKKDWETRRWNTHTIAESFRAFGITDKQCRHAH